MANVNIIQQPPSAGGVAIHQGHSPIVIELATESTGVASSNAFLSFSVGSPVIPGDSFVFNGTTYVASDDPSSNEFLTTTASTTGEVTESIARMLQNDPNVNYAYLFEPNTGLSVIAITAINAGSQWDITATIAAPFTLILLIAGNDGFRGMEYQDYMVWMEVYVNPFLSFASNAAISTGNILTGLLMKPYASSNSMAFDLQAFIQQNLSIDLPSLSIGFFRTSGNWIEYSWKYGEQFTRTGFINPLRTQIGQSLNQYAIKGAFGNNEVNDLTTYYQPTGARKWLTNQVTSRLIQFDGDYDWLYFLWYDSVPGLGSKYLAISVSITWIDGAQFDAGRFFPSLGVNGMHGVRVDPQAFNMASIETLNNKVIGSYTVALVESTNISFSSFSVRSEAFEFAIDRKCTEYSEFCFVWLEPMGSFAGYTFRGITATQPDRSFQTYLKGRNIANMQSSDQVRAIRVVDYSITYQTNSGFLDKPTYNWLRDSLLKSPSVYVVLNDELHSIIVTGSNAQDQSDNDIPDMSITWQFTEPANTVTQ